MLNFKIYVEDKDLDQLAKDANVDISSYDPKQLRMGLKAEKEHSGGKGKDVQVVSKKSDLLKIAIAHLREDPKYYTKLANCVEEK